MISYAQYASWLIEWTLLTFHLSVSFFVAHQVFRKKWPFTTGFYKIYLIQSVFDVCNYFAVCRDLKSLTIRGPKLFAELATASSYASQGHTQRMARGDRLSQSSVLRRRLLQLLRVPKSHAHRLQPVLGHHRSGQ